MVEKTLGASCIKERRVGGCEHLTLPSSVMGTHCVLTFKFPRFLPSCLSRCFPPFCYLAVRAGDLTTDLKGCSGTSSLFNDFLPPISFPKQVCNRFFLSFTCDSLSSTLHLTLSIFLLCLPPSLHCCNESERRNMRVSYQYADCSPSPSAEP